MTQCFPPLSALVRPEPHSGAPMTTENAVPTIEGDARTVAENLLHRAATLAIVLGNEQSDPSVAALITQAMAIAGAGYAQLAALDSADEAADRNATLAGDVQAHLRPAVEPDLLIDNNGDVWLRRWPTVDFHCVTSNLDDRAESDVSASFGPCREFAQLPPRPGR